MRRLDFGRLDVASKEKCVVNHSVTVSRVTVSTSEMLKNLNKNTQTNRRLHFAEKTLCESKASLSADESTFKSLCKE